MLENKKLELYKKRLDRDLDLKQTNRLKVRATSFALESCLRITRTWMAKGLSRKIERKTTREK